jgi:hypothetical protein
MIKFHLKPFSFWRKSMLETYKATIHGDKIEWETDAPDYLQNGKAVEVFITVLDEPKDNNLRPFGLAEGQFIVPDDFDAPLPEDVLSSFEQ